MALPLAVAIPAAAAAATTAYGAIRAPFDQASANRYNAREAEKARAFAAHERETAMQDAVRDYRLAGINPIHAAKMGGAAQPASAQASFSNVDPSGKAVAAGQALLNASLTASQVELNQAQARNLNAQADTTEKSQPHVVDKIRTEVFNLDMERDLKWQLFDQLAKLNPVEQQQVHAALEHMQLQNKHTRADLNRAFNEAEMEKFFSGPAGNWLRLLRGFFNSGAAR